MGIKCIENIKCGSFSERKLPQKNYNVRLEFSITVMDCQEFSLDFRFFPFPLEKPELSILLAQSAPFVVLLSLPKGPYSQISCKMGF